MEENTILLADSASADSENLSITEVVSIPFSLYQACLGNYYIGRTPSLTLRPCCHAWGGLINPIDSNVNLCVDTISITNTAGCSVCARLWLNTTPFGRICLSSCVASANTAANPCPSPQGALAYAKKLCMTPFNGDSLSALFTRPCTTESLDLQGKVVVPPGGSCLIFICAPSNGIACAEVSCQWWECERNNKCQCQCGRECNNSL